MDPLNWEISSNNKQRQIYANLHRELTAKGLSRDQIVALSHQLDVMSPGGSFIAYLNKLRESQVSMMNSNDTQKSQAAIHSESLDKSPLLSPVPSLDFSKIYSTPVPVSKLPSQNIGTSSLVKDSEGSTSLLRIPQKQTSLPAIDTHQRSLPLCMDQGLSKDQRSIYVENHKMTEDSLNKFLDDVKASEIKYRRARRARLKAKRLMKTKTRRSVPAEFG